MKKSERFCDFDIVSGEEEARNKAIKITIAINIKWQAAAATGRKSCGGEKERKRFLFSPAKKHVVTVASDLDIATSSA